MKNNKLMWITTIVCLLPLLLSIFVYKKLPEEVAIHFNEVGKPDNYAPKAFAAFGLPILLAILNIFTHFVIDHDPKKNYSAAAFKVMGKWLIPILSLVLVPVTLFIALGYDIPISNITLATVGAVIFISGNYLPKCRQNYTVGIKLPWTLNSEVNWNKTHHLAGYLWMIGGLMMFIGAFLNLSHILYIFTVILILVVIPFIYSYLLFKKGI